MKAKKDKGETASIKSMITYAVDECSIDASRIFITGMSAGEGMSKVLLNAYPETFNAEALLAAPPSLPGGLSDTSRTVPRALITQGDEDKVVTPAMGEKVLVQWLTKNELDSLNRETTANFMENELLRTRSYSRDQEWRIIILNVEGIGHKILIDPGEGFQQGGRLATAKLFHQEVAKVVITGRRKEVVEAAAKEIGDNAVGIIADTSNMAAIDHLYKEVEELHGKIDVLFLNAGVAIFAPIEFVNEEMVDTQFNINVKGLYFNVQKALPLMKAGGSIILTTSAAD